MKMMPERLARNAVGRRRTVACMLLCHLTVLVVLLAGTALVCAQEDDLRIWTARSGATAEARLQGVMPDKVVLEKKDGARIVVSVDRLCEKDQDYIKQWARKRQTGPETEPASGKTSRPSTRGRKRGFVVLDAVQYLDKPSFGDLPFHPIRVIYQWEMWPGAKGLEAPNREQKEKVARSLEPSDFPYVIDIEHWKVDGDDATAEESISKYIEVIECMREARPDGQFAFYGLLPVRDYWSPVGGKPEQLRQWREKNKRLRKLVPHVDAVFPSIYAFYDDVAGWEKYAKANLQEARRYRKPVYAFLWPEYHNSNKELKGQLIPGHYWAAQLKLCRKYADGIVIWTSKSKKWDPKAEWWLETERFIRRYAK